MNSINDFYVINDVQQVAKRIHFKDGQAIHMATIGRLTPNRGLKEYIVFRSSATGTVYFEEIERNLVNYNIKKIACDMEWADLVKFCTERGYLNVGGETKIGT